MSQKRVKKPVPKLTAGFLTIFCDISCPVTSIGDAQSPVTARLRDITSCHGIRHKCDI